MSPLSKGDVCKCLYIYRCGGSWCDVVMMRCAERVGCSPQRPQVLECEESGGVRVGGVGELIMCDL